MDIELAQTLAENKLLKSLLYCTKRSCNNCGKVTCENFQRQRKDCCENWVSYKDYIKELEQKNHAMLVDSLKICNQSEIDNDENERKIAELTEQIEELIDFVLSKTECCDVCPITDTCINSEGTCHYAGILAKGEEEVTREWLMQKITKEIKEK